MFSFGPKPQLMVGLCWTILYHILYFDTLPWGLIDSSLPSFTMNSNFNILHDSLIVTLFSTQISLTAEQIKKETCQTDQMILVQFLSYVNSVWLVQWPLKKELTRWLLEMYCKKNDAWYLYRTRSWRTTWRGSWSMRVLLATLLSRLLEVNSSSIDNIIVHEKCCSYPYQV